jgi:hypothetical protein
MMKIKHRERAGQVVVVVVTVVELVRFDAACDTRLVRWLVKLRGYVRASEDGINYCTPGRLLCFFFFFSLTSSHRPHGKEGNKRCGRHDCMVLRKGVAFAAGTKVAIDECTFLNLKSVKKCIVTFVLNGDSGHDFSDTRAPEGSLLRRAFGNQPPNRPA